MIAAVYDLPEITRTLPQRTYPAKGERVGTRWIRPSGTASKRNGFPWMPGVVEKLTAQFLYVRNPQTGLIEALDLYEPWEIAPADSLTFWKFCPTCKGQGDVYQWKDPIDPAKDVVVSCVECSGWGELGEHPFKVSRRTKQRLAAKSEPRTPVTADRNVA